MVIEFTKQLRSPYIWRTAGNIKFSQWNTYFSRATDEMYVTIINKIGFIFEGVGTLIKNIEAC